MTPLAAYDAFLTDRAARMRLRQLRPTAPGAPGRIRVGGRELLNFASNDYLGLSRHPLLVERARAWAAEYGTGSAASRLICGDLELFGRVESRLAAGKKVEAALIFNTGFQANGAILGALLDRGVLGGEPRVYADRLNHASLHGGIQAAGARQIRYRHNDLNHLADLLHRDRYAPGARFIVSESVFSMDGDQVDAVALAALAREHDAFLYLDEAHATGVLGENGFGLAQNGLADLAMGTFSKALGGFGAYAACGRRLREYLINRCAGLIYSTALPPAVLGAMDAALELLPSLEETRRALLTGAEALRRALRDSGLETGNSTTPIIPVMVGEDGAALAISRRLEEEGVWIPAVRPPAVPEGTARLRLSLTAHHGPAEREAALRALLRAMAGA
ncbi:MAG: 8-amino-7-oxononanoate synthase [Magnetococcales bacterium]|nr:8-amino-7-oxononanoate synthase [Magnetococcales bacterium]